MIQVEMGYIVGLVPTLAVARNSQTINIANLLKYAVHGRGIAN